jgi:Ca2+-binding EF-hand superfamily protein
MFYPHRITPPIILTLAVLMAAPAFAQAQGTLPPAAKRDWADYYLARVDTDNKGYITLEDAKRYASAQFDRLDVNHGGQVDHDEFVASLKRAVEHASTLDRQQRLQRALDRRETLFHTLDQKGDGKITKEEYVAAAVQHFNELDIDKTGKVTVQELRVARHGL